MASVCLMKMTWSRTTRICGVDQERCRSQIIRPRCLARKTECLPGVYNIPDTFF